MKNFNQRGGERRGFRPERRDFARGPVTMHKATCSECGEICEVPFRPTGDKPVYCNKCFESKRGGSERAPRRDFARSSQSGGNEEIKRQLEAINNKLDQLIRALSPKEESKEKENKVEGKTAVKSAKKKAAVKKAKKS